MASGNWGRKQIYSLKKTPLRVLDAVDPLLDLLAIGGNPNLFVILLATQNLEPAPSDARGIGNPFLPASHPKQSISRKEEEKRKC
jgi:hypothetical protein